MLTKNVPIGKEDSSAVAVSLTIAPNVEGSTKTLSMPPAFSIIVTTKPTSDETVSELVAASLTFEINTEAATKAESDPVTFSDTAVGKFAIAADTSRAVTNSTITPSSTRPLELWEANGAAANEVSANTL
jgi:hypothetical protein